MRNTLVIAVLAAGFIALLIGMATGWLLSRRDSLGSAFGALGGVAGLMLGLSDTPVLGGAITSAFTLIAVLIPVYFPAQQPADERPRRRVSPPLLGTWLLPFACMLAAGALLGILLRVNDSLNLASPSLYDHYKRLGFDESQVKLILSRHAKALAGERPNLHEQYKELGFTAEQAKEIMDRQARTILLEPEDIKPIALETTPRKREPYLQRYSEDKIDYRQMWTELIRNDSTPDENLGRLKAGAGIKLTKRISQLEQDGVPAAQILLTLKQELDIQ